MDHSNINEGATIKRKEEDDQSIGASINQLAMFGKQKMRRAKEIR